MSLVPIASGQAALRQARRESARLEAVRLQAAPCEACAGDRRTSTYPSGVAPAVGWCRACGRTWRVSP